MTIALDQQAFNTLYSLAHKLPLLDGLFIFAAKYLFWLIIVAVFVSLFRKKNWNNSLSVGKNRFQYFSLGLIAFLLSRAVATNIIQSFFNSPRPFVALGIDPLVNHAAANSFPSGHMASLMPIVLTLFLINPKAGRWGIFLTLVVGLARVIAGLHWPSDILAGILIGSLSFWIIAFVFRRQRLI
ncbi:MAG: hypothetical protein A2Y84_01870 [Candidatus Colwellbacteria bacterium RBG_13_48_8]|uniref:Phosphatidic acid phosphatase type 2/haloperoxidase domain-containing protein n=1 Tax=Candidatus Colwellbacteria bacterium RBG_13_48_8 TaxID=1797685 RepID=A0A1G1YVK7_9BACT|nr:MAG: hypothetical protein A2Y84_01870 [Candidatus Colwellbacteria bacterium RBG_13_48_8]